MWGRKKKPGTNNLVQGFNKAARIVQVTLYSELVKEYKNTLDIELGKILAAQVANFLSGEVVNEEQLESNVKDIYHLIRDKIRPSAFTKLDSDPLVREVVVYTLRMKTVLMFGTEGKTYLATPEKQQAEEILGKYGTEFPKEAVPSDYFKLVTRYHEERFRK